MLSLNTQIIFGRKGQFHIWFWFWFSQECSWCQFQFLLRIDSQSWRGGIVNRLFWSQILFSNLWALGLMLQPPIAKWNLSRLYKWENPIYLEAAVHFSPVIQLISEFKCHMAPTGPIDCWHICEITHLYKTMPDQSAGITIALPTTVLEVPLISFRKKVWHYTHLSSHNYYMFTKSSSITPCGDKQQTWAGVLNSAPY